MRMYLVNFIFIILFINNGSEGFAQNNLSIINNLVDQIIYDKDIYKNVSGKDSISIIVTNFNDEEKKYILFRVGNVLLEKSFTVFRNFIPVNSFQGMILEIDHFTVSVYYSKPYKKKFLGEKYSKRKIIVGIEGQFFDNKSKQVLQSIIETSQYEDEIKYDQIDNLEKSSYQFTIGQRAAHSTWQRLFEPVLIISSCVAIIYIFFTQRV